MTEEEIRIRLDELGEVTLAPAVPPGQVWRHATWHESTMKLHVQS